jgi:anti-sigma factor RsiW
VTEHLSQQMVESYGKRQLSATELISVDAHLAVCETCRTHLYQVEYADEMSTSLLTGLHREAQKPLQHLSYEELDAYIGETLDETDREVVISHLQICLSCKEEMQDLLAFKTSIDTQQNLPAVASVPIVRRWSERWKKLLQVPAYRLVLQTTMVYLLAAIAGLFLFLSLKQRTNELQAQLIQLQQQNAELQKRNDGVAELQAQLDRLRQENEALLLSQPVIESPDKVLALKDAGGVVTLDEEGRLQGLTVLSAANQQLIKNALRSGSVLMPTTISDVTAKAGVLMSGSSPGVSFALQSPVGTFVQSARPVFRWRELKGATFYIVTVYDPAFRIVAKSEAVKKTEWTPDYDLEPGITFRWQVTAMANDQGVKSPVPPAPEARFKIIESAKAQDLQQTRQALANSHLALGVLYAQAGLLDDAERELQILIRANPQANIAKKLLQSVKARRR